MRKGIVFAVVVWFLVIGLLVGGYFGLRYYRQTYVSIDGIRYLRDSTALDLSGTPVEQLDRLTEFPGLTLLDLRDTGLTAAQFDTLQAAMPGCTIQWEPLFQGKYYSCDTKTITVTSLTEEEVMQLDYLPQLSTVYASNCPDLDALLLLQSRHPDCRIIYDVTIAGEEWDHDATYLVLPGDDTEMISEQLRYLPNVERILLMEPLAPMEDITALRDAYPNIFITYLVDICGYTASPDAVELALSDIAMQDLRAVERALSYLPEVKKIVMCNCGIPNEDMAAIDEKYSNIRFIWSVKVGPFTLRTDATAFIPIKYGYWLNDEECYNLRYCVDMVALDLGHCYISNCEFVSFMPKLKYLILADTDISDISPIANHEELVYLELFLTNVRDYTPLLSCPALEDLNICYTYGQIGVISQMTQLKRLWWSPGSDGKYWTLSQNLPNTYLELNTASSTGEGWREGQRYYEQRDMLDMYYMEG